MKTKNFFTALILGAIGSPQAFAGSMRLAVHGVESLQKEIRLKSQQSNLSGSILGDGRTFHFTDLKERDPRYLQIKLPELAGADRMTSGEIKRIKQGDDYLLSFSNPDTRASGKIQVDASVKIDHLELEWRQAGTPRTLSVQHLTQKDGVEHYLLNTSRWINGEKTENMARVELLPGVRLVGVPQVNDHQIVLLLERSDGSKLSRQVRLWDEGPHIIGPGEIAESLSVVSRARDTGRR